MPAFSDFAINPRLLKAIDAAGFSEPTPVQAAVIPTALEGKDILACAKTGGGKTAAFVIPLLQQLCAEDRPRSATRGLILVPTRELALQMQKNIKALAAFTQIKSQVIMGGEAFKYQISDLRKNPEILIATPGRLVEHITKGSAELQDLEVLILDEADRMLDMGFVEDMYSIISACNPERQTLLFSATLSHKELGIISSTLKEPAHFQIDKVTDAHSNITQEKIITDDDKHKLALTAELLKLESPEKTIIFCKTREQCQTVANILKYKKINAAYLHGELNQSDRKQVLNRFRDNKLDAIIATDVAARGLDIDDVDLVINFTVAHSGDDHVHRIGRTGRQNHTGKAVTLVNSADWNLMASIERYLKIKPTMRKIKGLEANYTGPKKQKSNGKAVGKKKPKNTKPAQKSKNKKALKKESTPNKDSATNIWRSKDGSAPLRRKPR